MRAALGVCAICKNEERDLPGFISHLLDWVDEIVLIDDGSTDRTKDIALSYGDRVKFIENRMGENRDFGRQRNISIEHSTSEWLLHMDIDERVTPELAQSILKNIRNTSLNAFKYRRLNHFLHYPMKGGGWQYWNKAQLARRGFHHFENKVHEKCVVEGGEQKTGQLRGYMWHLIDASYEERLTKNITYSKLTGNEIQKKVKKVRWYHLLFHPLYRAFQSYFLQKGYKEGIRGLIFALYTFSGTFNWWVFAWEKQNFISRKQLEEQLERAWKNADQLHG